MLGKKITMAAIAREAKVGIATVDRVMNRRSPVRPATELRVIEAAKKLGFVLEKSHYLSAMTGAPERRLKMGFILLRREHSFYAQLADALLAQATPYHEPGQRPQFVFQDINAIGETAAAITRLSREVDVIGVLALDNALIRYAVEEACRAGVKVFALLSDLSVRGRAGFIGLDNQQAGRTAAWAVDRLCRRQGEVGVIIGDNRFLCQEACESSFRSYLREQMSGLRVLEPVRSHEDAETAHRVTHEMLQRHSELVALYAPSGGVEGIFRALRESGRQQDVMLVCHGPVAGADMALIDGTLDLMLSHRIAEFAAAIIDTFVAAAANVEQSGQLLVLNRFDLITKENI
ncbi:LacI family DNA-binding transcriptional regulator [Serratia entomophila]|uniref:LacI family DNA-binding transcriptional regulator n=1 Tax=Serratia entomophila TaxID=42906 RepID=UPI0021790A5D|nr:LacI family DNA-binding transcriptional regulator [Serratia entomophila]CAI0865119.1 Catabolite control protein [Serratia entomophila]CAI1517224.1 Catabolite control protein [Serratia entomophila]CAI1583749.1 Catabolite control protein [Serratia entomophila]CAI1713395.1 Catabolite control protein [Serratia entomophila]CAI1815728.1 Catabolite control protein [Serratia entomophila]